MTVCKFKSTVRAYKFICEEPTASPKTVNWGLDMATVANNTTMTALGIVESLYEGRDTEWGGVRSSIVRF